MVKKIVKSYTRRQGRHKVRVKSHVKHFRSAPERWDSGDERFFQEKVEEYKSLAQSHDTDWPSEDYRTTRLKQLDSVINSMTKRRNAGGSAPKIKGNYSMGWFQNGKLNDFPEKEVLNLKATDEPIKLRGYQGWNKSDRKPFDITITKDSDVTITPVGRNIQKVKENTVNLSPIGMDLPEEDIEYKWKVPKEFLDITAYDTDPKDSGQFHEIRIKPKGEIEIAPHEVRQRDLWHWTVTDMAKMHGEKNKENEHRKDWKDWRKSVGFKD